MKNKLSLKRINKAVELSKNRKRPVKNDKETINHNFWVRIIK